MYNTTGMSHQNGLNNEKESQKFLSSFDEGFQTSVKILKNIKKIESIGGTKDKTDTIIFYDDGTEKHVSNKNFSANGSSFDFANISSKEIMGKILPIEKYRVEVEKKAKDLRQKDCTQREKKEFKDFRKQQANISLDDMEDEHIRRLLEEIFNPLIDHVIMITDRRNKKYQFIETSELDVVKYLVDLDKNTQFFLKKKRESQKVCESRTICVRQGEKEIDLKIRIRLVTNNGDSAAIGLNKNKPGKNNHSSPVVKIQQDSVKELLKKHNLPNCSIPFEEKK